MTANISETDRNNNFNIIRACAAFLVIAGHGFILNGLKAPTMWGQPIHSFGLYLLFILGGYLIAQSWKNDPNILHYSIKRIMRICPPLVVLIFITVFAFGPILTDLSTEVYFQYCWKYLKNIIFYPIYDLPGVFLDNPYRVTVNGSLWTLPVEMFFYALVPVIILIISKINNKLWPEIIIISLLIITTIATYFIIINGTRLVFYGTDWFSALRLFPFYLMGILYTRNSVKKYLSLPFSIILIILLQAIGLTNPES